MLKEDNQNPDFKDDNKVHMENCPFIPYCNYCEPSNYKNCCLYSKLQNNDFKKCNSYRCINSYDCIDMREGKILEEHIPKLNFLDKVNYQIKKPLKKFTQCFIPRIDISSSKNRNKQIEVIKELNVSTIAISLQDIMSEDKDLIIKSSLIEDLHNILNYNDKILLITNISDAFCEKILNNAYRYIDLLQILNPDIITTFDANFYVSQPYFISMDRIRWIMEANELIKDLDIFQIGIIPPAPFLFFKAILKKMLDIGHKTVGIPLLEINRDRNFELRYKFLNTIYNFKSKFKFNFILISTNPPKIQSIGSKKLVLADCFSSHSWVVKNVSRLSFSKKKNVWKKNLIDSINRAENIANQKRLNEFIKR